MGKIIEMGKNTNENVTAVGNEEGVLELTENILEDVRTDILKSNVISMPIAELAALGAGVASLMPALRTVTRTTTMNTSGLYQLANASVGDALKATKNGEFWGALKTAEGKSKMARLKTADPMTATSTVVMPIDPATMMMAVALFSIEKQIGNIAETGKQILSFLEIEKESEVEAGIETLSNILTRYKHSWDNDYFISSSHKLVMDIQWMARKNMLSYQKKVEKILNCRQLLVAQANVSSVFKDIQKKLQYYRLSLYTFAMSAFLEIMLSGNFKEENITGIMNEIEKLSMDYREVFQKCSAYLEKLSKSSMESNVLKGVGAASKAVGKFIGSIPIVKEGPVDEFLQDGGKHLEKNAMGMERDLLSAFASISNPGTGIFVQKMKDMIQIYNHTEKICFDDKRIYLIAG